MSPATSDVAARLASFFQTSRRPGLVSAYLFGSLARHASHRESDVDVAVLLDVRIFPAAQQRFEARVDLIGALASALAIPEVDLVILNDAPPHLARRILTEGTRVFCADAE